MTSPGMEKATFFCRAEQEKTFHGCRGGGGIGQSTNTNKSGSPFPHADGNHRRELCSGQSGWAKTHESLALSLFYCGYGVDAAVKIVY